MDGNILFLLMKPPFFVGEILHGQATWLSTSARPPSHRTPRSVLGLAGSCASFTPTPKKRSFVAIPRKKNVGGSNLIKLLEILIETGELHFYKWICNNLQARSAEDFGWTLKVNSQPVVPFDSIWTHVHLSRGETHKHHGGTTGSVSEQKGFTFSQSLFCTPWSQSKTTEMAEFPQPPGPLKLEFTTQTLQHLGFMVDYPRVHDSWGHTAITKWAAQSFAENICLALGPTSKDLWKIRHLPCRMASFIIFQWLYDGSEFRNNNIQWFFVVEVRYGLCHRFCAPLSQTESNKWSYSAYFVGYSLHT